METIEEDKENMREKDRKEKDTKEKDTKETSIPILELIKSWVTVG